MKLTLLIFLFGLVSMSSGLRCQVCGGGTGLCSSDGDNGESMECTEDLDSCYYYIATIGDEEATYRSCGKKFTEGCYHQSTEDAEVTVCNCDTDNCNKDHDCECNSSTTTQATTTTSSSTALKCQQCTDYQCSSSSDNGQSVTCSDIQDICYFATEKIGTEETVYRGCINNGGKGDGCITTDFDGYEASECFCTTDNCNKDNQCDYCSSSTGLKCQRCDGENGQCSSSSDNGKSVTCAEDQDACFYQSIRNGDEEIVYRNCLNSAGVGDECVNSDHNGIGITDCFCTTDNCNKDDQCNC